MDKNTDETINFIGSARILIAPLDWGLGHATRCIPIIYALVAKGHTVFIAAEGPSKILLQNEFSDIEYLPLKGYGINYSKTRYSLLWTILLQVPRILKAIMNENRWLKKTIKSKDIDIVISDNRFGLYHRKTRCIFITHQLIIKAPFLQRVLQKMNYHFINKFDECWIPDFKGEPNLAGNLSHPKEMPTTPARYIGWLSRFNRIVEQKETHLLVLLSGPEPQRTILEKKIADQLKTYLEPVVIIRGLPGSDTTLQVGNHITCFNHLPAKQLEDAIQSSSIVIARSGYSSIMDLLKLKKKSILIPTPGQTEQEYLGQHLLQNKLAFCCAQETFDLKNALEAASVFEYSVFDRDASFLLDEALSFR